MKVVRVPTECISSASPAELGYLAGLIDGEGNLDIRRTEPRISIKMKSIEPLNLAKKYGGYWYVQVNRKIGSVYYLWYVSKRPLLDNLVTGVMGYSRIKKEQFSLLFKALEITKAQQPGWKDQTKELANKLHRMHHENPAVTREAAESLDDKKPGWREYVQEGTTIEC